MYVEQIMSRNLDTVKATDKLSHAAQVMRENGRRYLPVVDDNNNLVGLFGQKQLAQAEPSPITTLSAGEVNYLTSKITVGELMLKDVYTCESSTLIEEAGRMIREKKVGNLPVIDNGELVGVVSETDILDFFLDITGCNLPDTTRIAVNVPDEIGALSALLEQINTHGGYIATVNSPIQQDAEGKRIVIIRHKSDHPASLDNHLRDLGYELITEEFPK